MHRNLAVLLVTCGMALSGCLGSEAPGAAAPNEANDGDPTPPAILPDDIMTDFAITPAFDIPSPATADDEFCWMPSAGCIVVPFHVAGNTTNITATIALSWTVPANNLGLFLYRGADELEADSGPRPTNIAASISATLVQGGDYQIVIDPHWAVADTAHLTATFA